MHFEKLSGVTGLSLSYTGATGGTDGYYNPRTGSLSTSEADAAYQRIKASEGSSPSSSGGFNPLDLVRDISSTLFGRKQPTPTRTVTVQDNTPLYLGIGLGVVGLVAIATMMKKPSVRRSPYRGIRKSRRKMMKRR